MGTSISLPRNENAAQVNWTVIPGWNGSICGKTEEAYQWSYFAQHPAFPEQRFRALKEDVERMKGPLTWKRKRLQQFFYVFVPLMFVFFILGAVISPIFSIFGLFGGVAMIYVLCSLKEAQRTYDMEIQNYFNQLNSQLPPGHFWMHHARTAGGRNSRRMSQLVFQTPMNGAAGPGALPQVGYNPGIQQGIVQGYNPALQQGGYNPGTQQGGGGGYNQGVQPGGYNSGMQGGYNPGMQQGGEGGFNQGMQPGGYNSGMQGGGSNSGNMVGQQGGSNDGMYQGGGYNQGIQPVGYNSKMQGGGYAQIQQNYIAGQQQGSYNQGMSGGARPDSDRGANGGFGRG